MIIRDRVRNRVSEFFLRLSRGRQGRMCEGDDQGGMFHIPSSHAYMAGYLSSLITSCRGRSGVMSV